MHGTFKIIYNAALMAACFVPVIVSMKNIACQSRNTCINISINCIAITTMAFVGLFAWYALFAIQSVSQNSFDQVVQDVYTCTGQWNASSVCSDFISCGCSDVDASSKKMFLDMEHGMEIALVFSLSSICALTLQGFLL